MKFLNILDKEIFLSRSVTTQLRGFAMLLILVGHVFGAFGEVNLIPLVPNRLATPMGG